MITGNRAQGLMQQGAAALQRGDLVHAADAFAAAAETAPALADAWFNLAWVQRALRRFEEALGSYGRALEAGVAGPEEAHVNRAAILADHLFRTDEAVADYERALTLQPGFAPALAGLAQLFEDEGRTEEAKGAYRRLLEAAPGNGRALARIAMIDLQGGDPGQVAADLTAAMRRGGSTEDQAELLFALASAQDAGERYGEAFSTLLQANRLSEQLSGRRYDRAAFEQLVSRLIAAFPEAWPETAIDQAAPIFLCGPFRSGSTLTEQILARHPDVRAGGELEAVPAIAAGLQPYPEAILQLPADLLDQLRAAYRAEAALVPGAGRRTTDKRCDNFRHIGLIQTLFPAAPIVHTSRHPLDTLVSTLFLRFGDGVSYGHRLEDAAHQAIQHHRLMQHWRRIMPGRIHDFSYDALVREPEAALRPLAGFLQLSWDDRLLRPAQAGTVRTASNWQVRQPLHARSSGRWRHYAAPLEPVRRMLEAAGVPLPD
ncbi:tetratricopeptide repeat-containing sulfotransferase family protein [Sphingomonas glaciei]|uniref:Sulfotransferase n=1 Tax=Sphingomonas glaciei TaxID=2938948 RepID=A0ABY5MYN1_9SPHN|nr:sulfotransferase [Sphingomonas glaciei]UUR07456.1 sulfotransferase [Sphingomonas glaciei]